MKENCITNIYLSKRSPKKSNNLFSESVATSFSRPPPKKNENPTAHF